ncbi:Oidioi.mRNA.OKI2018_I69.PAR.g12533.t1.cds [Oikopleura dioica]|uniref:Oidioi.mRNA.OKI2018_I69.PAR.g12533.t1.cds n=1 Tax=Oikopleura dioica TaxID=34765 RepID=A0ABN7S0G5_OIKDI|nr:Oidioi.mRNA.OKI2018_I69.PAR.g12533.t1.cds [Oikopleura dioica]
MEENKEKTKSLEKPAKLKPGRVPDAVKSQIVSWSSLMTNKKFSIHQKKEIVQLHLENPELGYKKLVKIIPEKLGYTISRSSLRLILKNKQLLLETVTSERSTRSNFISPIMNLFRKTVVAKINALDTIATNSEIKSICLETAKEEEFKDDAKLRKMTFCDDWVGSLKKDFNLKSATGQFGKLRK